MHTGPTGLMLTSRPMTALVTALGRNYGSTTSSIKKVKMELYLLIGFFFGMVMSGIYWALPITNTGPKSFGIVALYLVSSPFLWPMQLAYYVVRLIVRGQQ